MGSPDRLLPPTEQRLPASAELDSLSIAEVLLLLNDEDATAVAAVRAIVPETATLVEQVAERFQRGGTVHYFGAGTSGRLGVLDAAELAPTFHVEPGRVVGHIAGGVDAMVRAVEDAEDSAQAGAADAADLRPEDTAIGIAASGNTPYVRGALAAARRAGAATALISSNPHAAAATEADTHLLLATGAEVVTGSTRLKAATAQKLVLHGFSTALMVRLGRVYSNWMVAVVPTNAKLRDRAARTFADITGVPPSDAPARLAEAGGDLKTALVAELAGVSVAESAAALRGAQGSVRAAMVALRRDGPA